MKTKTKLMWGAILIFLYIIYISCGVFKEFLIIKYQTSSSERLQLRTADNGKIERRIMISDDVFIDFCWIPPGKNLLNSGFDLRNKNDKIRGVNIEDNDINTYRFFKFVDSSSIPFEYIQEQGFWMSKYEITNLQYQAIMSSSNQLIFGSSSFPVLVTYFNATDFCKKISQLSAIQFRLPDQDEWEYAARGGTTYERYWGNCANGRYANLRDISNYKENLKEIREMINHQDWEIPNPIPYPDDLDKPENTNDGFPGLAPVGEFLPNPWGLHDMIGNIKEFSTLSDKRSYSYFFKKYKSKRNKNDDIDKRATLIALRLGGGCASKGIGVSDAEPVFEKFYNSDKCVAGIRLVFCE